MNMKVKFLSINICNVSYVIIQLMFLVWTSLINMAAVIPPYVFISDDPTKKHPGQLVIENKAKYNHNKSNKTGSVLYYSCANKHVTKCSAAAQVSVLEYTGETKFILFKLSSLDAHNHETNEGQMISETMFREMEFDFADNLIE